MRRHASSAALWPTLAATWLAFAQVLSFQGLAIWVVGGSVLTGLVTQAAALSGRRLLAAAFGAGVTVVVTSLANSLGGESAGPVTRSALMACGVTAAMAVLLSTRYPASLLAPSLLLLGGALGLGATGAAPWTVGIWAVAAAATLAMLGPYPGPDLADRRRLLPFALVLGAVGLAAVVAVAVSSAVLGEAWTVAGSTRPGSLFGATPSGSAVDPTPTGALPASGLAWVEPLLVLLAMLAGLALVVIVIAALLRRAVAAVRWSLLHRRLSRGAPESRVIGAWTWARLRLARDDRRLPSSASPDVAARLAAADGDAPLERLADLAATVAFNPAAQATTLEADEAWLLALEVTATPVGATLRDRWRRSAYDPR